MWEKATAREQKVRLISGGHGPPMTVASTGISGGALARGTGVVGVTNGCAGRGPVISQACSRNSLLPPERTWPLCVGWIGFMQAFSASDCLPHFCIGKGRPAQARLTFLLPNPSLFGLYYMHPGA